MMLDSLIFLFLAFCAGFCAGWIIRGVIVILNMMRDPEHWEDLLKSIRDFKRTKDNEESAPAGARKIKVEKHGDTLYLFAEDNDQFLAQGATLQLALDEIEKRFPNETFVGVLSKTDAEAMGVSVK